MGRGGGGGQTGCGAGGVLIEARRRREREKESDKFRKCIRFAVHFEAVSYFCTTKTFWAQRTTEFSDRC